MFCFTVYFYFFYIYFYLIYIDFDSVLLSKEIVLFTIFVFNVISFMVMELFFLNKKLMKNMKNSSFKKLRLSEDTQNILIFS